MADPRPIPNRKPGEPTSGRDLRLTLRGCLERIERGDEAAVAIAARTLQQLQDLCSGCKGRGKDADGNVCGVCKGDGSGFLGKKAPGVLLSCRLQFAKILQDDEHHSDKIARTDRKLAIEERREDAAPAQPVAPIFAIYPPNPHEQLTDAEWEEVCRQREEKKRRGDATG